MTHTRDPFRSRLFSLAFLFVALLGCGRIAARDADAKNSAQAPRLNREFKLRAREQVTLKREGLRIKFVAVTEDSRCPVGVQCVWAGNAAVQLEVSIRGKAVKQLTLNTNGKSPGTGDDRYRGYTFKLVELKPYPQSSGNTKPRDYVATLLVVSRDERPDVSALTTRNVISWAIGPSWGPDGGPRAASER